jgi:hypothetical protein
MQLASTAMIAAMFALSLQLLVGGAGMVSLAQAAFFGLGAYAVYLLGRTLGRPPPILVSLPASAPMTTSRRSRGRGHRRGDDRAFRIAHARLLLPDDHPGLRTDAVLRLP